MSASVLVSYDLHYDSRTISLDIHDAIRRGDTAVQFVPPKPVHHPNLSQEIIAAL
jgi:hypothetical protein